MSLVNFSKRYLKPIVIITLLGVLALAVTACEDLGLTPAEDTTPEEEAPSAATINTADRAILVVQERLVSQAESYQAKVYLADFFTACDDWIASSDFLGDGTSIWYVVVNVTDVQAVEEKPHWQQVCWMVFADGKVMPSDRFQANALRIEADLQELSL
jgi:hypothetical protein